MSARKDKDTIEMTSKEEPEAIKTEISEGETKPKLRAKKGAAKKEVPKQADKEVTPKTAGREKAKKEAKEEEKIITVSRLKEKYRQEIIPQLLKELNYKNIMQVPKLKKVVLNIGLGEAIQNAKALEGAERDLSIISGQHPVTTRSKKSIAAFKLREGMPIGMMVTLRGKRMYDFCDKLVNVVLPRIRDFSGLPASSFDGHGNYSLGLKEQLAFPEIEYDKIDKIRGLEISFVTTAKDDKEGKRLLELLGMPFIRGDSA